MNIQRLSAANGVPQPARGDNQPVKNTPENQPPKTDNDGFDTFTPSSRAKAPEANQANVGEVAERVADAVETVITDTVNGNPKGSNPPVNYSPRSFFNNLWNGVKKGFNAVCNWFGSLWGKATDVATQAFESVRSGAHSLGNSIRQWILDRLS